MTNKQKLLLSAVVVLVFAMALGSVVKSQAKSRGSYMYENFEIFRSVFQTVRSYYYDVTKIKTRRLMYGAIKGMLRSLDDAHTSFLPPKELRNLSEDTSGQFGGLGIMIGIRDKKLTVISPIYGTPAWKKHIKSGDVITHINGKSSKGISLFDAVSTLRGKVGTKVNITIYRKGHDDPIKISIIRAIIKIKTVKSTIMKKEKIGYIKITGFSNNTTGMLRKVLKKMRKKRGLRALIVDVRNNPGGLLSAAINVTDLFLSKGMIVYTKGREIDQVRRVYAEQGTTIVPKNIPIVVLVNQGSASASEIFAGAMQDTKRGILIGDKTFGKGSVQTIRPLQDGSAIKLTIALYYTPAGRQIHKKGLVPDIKVKIPAYSKKEQKSLYRLINDGMLAKFVKKYPKAKKRDIISFRTRLRKKGIILSMFELERWINWENNKVGMPKLINLRFDMQLRKAVQMIKAGKVRVRSVKAYNGR